MTADYERKSGGEIIRVADGRRVVRRIKSGQSRLNPSDVCHGVINAPQNLGPHVAGGGDSCRVPLGFHVHSPDLRVQDFIPRLLESGPSGRARYAGCDPGGTSVLA